MAIDDEPQDVAFHAKVLNFGKFSDFMGKIGLTKNRRPMLFPEARTRRVP